MEPNFVKHIAAIEMPSFTKFHTPFLINIIENKKK
jgi:hypothetical protein